MVQLNSDRNRDRIKSALAVAAFHALLGYAFVTGLKLDLASAVADELKLFDVAEPPPPPVEEIRPAAKSAEPEEGAAAPAGLKAKATQVVAPPPEVRLEVPAPIIAAPIAGQGSAPSAGNSNIPGPGPGAGGVGTGTGSGGQGSGAGGGGVAQGARWLRGRLSNADYPPRAKDAGASGTVFTRIAVAPDGRVSGCTVTRSSGYAELDETTCRLIRQRYRYEPARDAQGRPVPDVLFRTHSWWTVSRGSRRRVRPPEEPPGEPF